MEIVYLAAEVLGSFLQLYLVSRLIRLIWRKVLKKSDTCEEYAFIPALLALGVAYLLHVGEASVVPAIAFFILLAFDFNRDARRAKKAAHACEQVKNDQQRLNVEPRNSQSPRNWNRGFLRLCLVATPLLLVAEYIWANDRRYDNFSEGPFYAAALALWAIYILVFGLKWAFSGFRGGS